METEWKQSDGRIQGLATQQITSFLKMEKLNEVMLQKNCFYKAEKFGRIN